MLDVRQYAGNAAFHNEDAAMRAMFAARKAVFIDLLKWDLPVLAGRYEVDCFDDEYARYLIVAGPEGKHLASARLLPTLRPHILGDLYAQLCPAGPPRGPAIFEITRFCLDRALAAPRRRQARDALVRALAEYALKAGIMTYTAVAPLAWARQILEFGWDCAPLGPARSIDGSRLMALRIDITRKTPALLAARGIIAAPTRGDARLN